jgi:hypothetical protein
MARCFHLPFMNDELVGMADYIKESLHDLQSGSYHRSRECFMADIVDDPHRETTPEGHVVSANNGTCHGGNETPPHPADGHGAAAGIEVPSHPCMNQLRER